MEKHISAPKDFFLKVEGMHCANCAEKITRVLEDSKLCESFWVDRATNVLRIRKGHGGLSDTQFIKDIQKRLKKIGYVTEVLSDLSGAGKNEWIGQLCYSFLGLLISIFFISPVSVPFERVDLLILLGLVVLFYLSFKGFAKGAFISLRNKSFSVDTLVSLGAGAAFLLSMVLIIAQIPGHLYWMEAFSILLLVSAGHYIENYVLVRADKTLRSLMVLAPPKAMKLMKNGKAEEVLVADLQIGDKIMLRPGDRVAVDGKIIEGRSDVDESLLTGESMPLSKGQGDLVYSGTLNLSGNLRYEVQKLGQDTLLSQIIETVLRVRQSRAEIQRFADRVSNVFVPFVIVLALGCFLLWLLTPAFMSNIAESVAYFVHTHNSHQPVFWKAFSSALGVLLISCPCALGLATPAALMAVSGMAAKRGILIRDGRAIENADKITHVFFDKTGTLSVAAPKKVGEWTTREFRPELVAPVASQSHHPMSRALAGKAQVSKLSAEIEEFPGEGIKAVIQEGTNKSEVLMGHALLIQRSNVKGLSQAQDFILQELEQGRGLVYWAQNGVLCAVFSFEDELRENVGELLRKFSTQAKVIVLSGDNKKVLSALAKKLNLKEEDVFGELTPMDKVNLLQSYQKQGKKVAFVGDGLNDAPVLQAADLGIAVSSASDLAKQSADIVLLSQDIELIFEAFQLAKKGMRTIRQNLIWAFAYNIIAIPLAFVGLISPVLCTLSMAFSDLVIIFNSVRVFISKKVI